MNIAFSALLVLILVLPGIVLRYSYARGPWRWSHPTSLRPLADEVAYSVVSATALHLLWIHLARWLGAHPDLGAVMVLLTGAYGPDGRLLEPTLASITGNVGAIGSYFGSLYVFSALAGTLAHFAIRRTGLDRRFRPVRFSNDWYYLLSGEVMEFGEVGGAEKNIAGVYLSAVVEMGGSAYLFRGIVADFSYDSDGQLDRILLRAAHRRRLDDDRSSTDPVRGDEERYYDIRGDFLVLRYSELKTLNLDYFEIEETGEVGASGGASDATPGGEPGVGVGGGVPHGDLAPMAEVVVRETPS